MIELHRLCVLCVGEGQTVSEMLFSGMLSEMLFSGILPDDLVWSALFLLLLVSIKVWVLMYY